MRDFALDPRVRKKKRLVAGCPDATEPTGSPAEETTEKILNLVNSVASYRIILCHLAEEFVSQDVVGE